MKMDPDIHVPFPNAVKDRLQICDHLNVTFGIMGLCLGFSNTSNADSLDIFRKSVVDRLYLNIFI